MREFATIDKLELTSSEIHAWALDSPASGSVVKEADRGLYVQGWVLTVPDVLPGPIVVRFKVDMVEVQRILPLNSGRPDVIQRVLGLPPSGHPQLRCGYAGYLAETPNKFSLGISIDSRVCWLCDVQLQLPVDSGRTSEPEVPKDVGKIGVIHGTDGWLFLDNDTNHSVDQHTGQLTLDSSKLSRWRDYLDKCNSLASDAGAQYAVLIAASKEQVLPEHYPFPESPRKVLNQVLDMCSPSDHVVNTGEILARQADKHACFIKTDTHWTDRGAMLATIALLGELSLNADKASQHFSSDLYHKMSYVGDLGIKLTPPVAAITEFLTAPPPPSDAAFDNHLPNIGRVLLFESGETLWSHSLLIFGASSAYPMLKYLKRLFSRILFIHSAGNIDADVIASEKPDFLVMQTTARFMLEPPHAGFSVRTAVLTKLKASSEDLRNSAVAAMADHSVQKLNLPYQLTAQTFQ